ncbi:MAG: hypothetical protein J6U65_08590 [Bacteroidaceae bacterium]|nr:hypothetical protein [Bacteroidaceae bacterium]
MARQSLFWGKAKGKLGEVVLYRAGGEQRSRTYVKDIKNPKSAAQMAQRIKMSSVVGFFRATRDILRNSFPNRPVSQSGFNAYAQATLPIAETAIARNLADEGLSVPLNYQISKGGLMLVPNGLKAASVADGATEQQFRGGLLFSPYTEEISAGVVSPGTEDLDELMRIELAQAGQQLPDKYNVTVIVSSYADDGFKTNNRTFRVDKSSGTAIVTGDSLPMDDVWPVAKVEVDGIPKLAFAVAMSEGAGNGAYMAGVIVSYNDENGKLQVNSDYMKFVYGDMELIEQFMPNGIVYQQYLEDLGVGASDVLSTK